jgi:hypothetical protein
MYQGPCDRLSGLTLRGWQISPNLGRAGLRGRIVPLSLLALLIGALLPPANAWQASQRLYSQRFGVYYELVPIGDAYGARLTGLPVPGSPLLQGQAVLETGDIITHLDSVPITAAAELERHHSQTAVAFVNVRTGQAEARWVYLPALGDSGVPPSSSYVPTSYTSGYSPRLGIHYDFVRYGNALGASLRSTPVPGSPLRQAQVQLERGDMITHLDGAPITNAASLEDHFAQTSVTFVNVRTGRAEGRWVFLPVQGAPGVPPTWSASDRVLPPITEVPLPPPLLVVPDRLKAGS